MGQMPLFFAVVIPAIRENGFPITRPLIVWAGWDGWDLGSSAVRECDVSSYVSWEEYYGL